MHNLQQARRASLRRANRVRVLTISLLTAALLLSILAVLTLTGCQETTEGTASSAVTSESSTAQPTSTTTAPAAFPVTVTDDTGTTVTINKLPQRIVSTAPSNTEILFALGVGQRVVGVTTLCDYPPEVKDLPKVGDFQANTEAITALSPDLVVGYSGNEDALAPLKSSGVPVLIMNPKDLAGIYVNIQTIGQATGAQEAAQKLVEQLKSSIESITTKAASAPTKPRVFYALDSTLWTAGPGSFVDELLKLANAENIGSSGASAGTQQYYQLTPEQLVAADPDIILLPNTAFTSVDEFVKDSRFTNLRAVKQGKVILIDDVIITRPGPRIADGLKTLAAALHPGLFE